MQKLTSDIWAAFRSIRDRWHPQKLDVLTGFLGTGAINVVRDLKVTPRIVFGLATAKAELPASQIAELKRLQTAGEIRVSKGLHAKLFLFDDSVLVVGSANLTKPGFETLKEVVVVTDNPALLRSARRVFEQTWSQSRTLNPENLRPARAGSGSFTGGSELGSAQSGGDSPFSAPLPGQRKLHRDAEAKAPVIRLCSYYTRHIDELESDDVTWSTSERARAGDLQLFCFVDDSDDRALRFADAAHSLWRATAESKRDSRRARWKVQGPFEVLVRFKNPVPKADFIRAGLLNEYGRWPQGYRGKRIRDRRKLEKVLIARNPRQEKQIVEALAVIRPVSENK